MSGSRRWPSDARLISEGGARVLKDAPRVLLFRVPLWETTFRFHIKREAAAPCEWLVLTAEMFSYTAAASPPPPLSIVGLSIDDCSLVATYKSRHRQCARQIRALVVESFPLQRRASAGAAFVVASIGEASQNDGRLINL